MKTYSYTSESENHFYQSPKSFDDLSECIEGAFHFFEINYEFNAPVRVIVYEEAKGWPRVATFENRADEL